MMCGFIRYLNAENRELQRQGRHFPGFVNPGDMRELKRLAALMRVPVTVFPDTGGVMDAPMTGRFEMYPAGGTTIPEIYGLGDCVRTLALGKLTSAEPAELLKKKYKVPYLLLPLPIGIEATDRFVMELSKLSIQEVPYELESSAASWWISCSTPIRTPMKKPPRFTATPIPFWGSRLCAVKWG
jgi:nitrogenase molybdenum-iron protein beta chain